MKWIHCLVVCLFSVWIDVKGHIDSPYQVSIVGYELSVTLGEGGSFVEFKLCSGAIIHERYILTTADCMQCGASNEKKRLASALQVTAGTFSTDHNNTRKVEEIIVHEKFNYTTLENNIAILKLDAPYVLKDNPSIQWIKLDNSNAKREKCFVSYLNQTSTGYPFKSPHSTNIIDNSICNKNLYAANYTEKDNEICSYYTLSDRSMCKFQPRYFQLSKDRGAALVCENHLSGLLSQIIPPLNTANGTAACETSLRTNAFFTRISNYAEWINQTIGQTAGSNVPPYHVPSDEVQLEELEEESTTESSTEGSGAFAVTKSFLAIITTSSISLILTLRTNG